MTLSVYAASVSVPGLKLIDLVGVTSTFGSRNLATARVSSVDSVDRNPAENAKLPFFRCMASNSYLMLLMTPSLRSFVSTNLSASCLFIALMAWYLSMANMMP